MLIRPGRYPAGCILGFEMLLEGVGTITHVGIMGDELDDYGLPTVVHSSKLYRCVIEMPMLAFAEKAQTEIRSLGYPGSLPPAKVLERARSRIGEAWTPFRNCEHFVTWCHGLPPRSPQLAHWLRLR